MFKKTVLASLLVTACATSYAAMLKQPVYLELSEGASSSENLKMRYRGGGKYQTDVELKKGNWSFNITDKNTTCGTSFSSDNKTRLSFSEELPVSSCISDKNIQLKIIFPGNYQITLNNKDNSNPKVSIQRKKEKAKAVKRTPPPVECIEWDGQPVTVEVTDVFENGEVVRDFYSGQTAVVQNGVITMMPDPDSGGLLLLESAEESEQTEYNWRNATVYFVMTDRFANGDPSNDHSYGRQSDGNKEIGSFHGGDLQGITKKLDYIDQLGVTAIWLTPIVEQVHGFVPGGKDGDFPFYGYHGYWAKDFTRIDANFGDEEALQTLVDEAHKRGIRVILDVVLNHAGYETAVDLAEQNPDLVSLSLEEARNWRPQQGQNWADINKNINYQSSLWREWWGGDWVRGYQPGYQKPGTTDETINLAGLPDFLTESEQVVNLPVFLQRKTDTRAEALKNARITDYLIKWQTDWVRKFGIDGFRADTVKHMSPEIWKQLKDEASLALEQWKQENPDKKLDDTPFWMVGEYWGHGYTRNYLYDYGFDSLINFYFQKYNSIPSSQCLSQANSAYQSYAKALQDPATNPLTYISSHDTRLFWGDFKNMSMQRGIASALLLMPGAVQIYYGDETARNVSAYPPEDMTHGTRSDMNWQEVSGERLALLEHWRKVSQFRKKHPAVGAGNHKVHNTAPYTFSRRYGDDRVVVVYAGRQN